MVGRAPCCNSTRHAEVSGLRTAADTMTKRSKDSQIVLPAGGTDEGDGHLDADQLDLSSSDEEDFDEEAGELEVDSRDDEDNEDAEDEDEEDGDELESSDDEVGRTVLDLIEGRGAGPGEGDDAEQTQDREDRTADAEPAHDPGSDSSEDERPSRNTGAAAAACPFQLWAPHMRACTTTTGLLPALCHAQRCPAAAGGGSVNAACKMPGGQHGIQLLTVGGCPAQWAKCRCAGTRTRTTSGTTGMPIRSSENSKRCAERAGACALCGLLWSIVMSAVGGASQTRSIPWPHTAAPSAPAVLSRAACNREAIGADQMLPDDIDHWKHCRVWASE